ncbi:MAG: FAD-dependent oxidoreductase, partial [Chloroflexi bacterium]|nr:FAD-dependent oxidoreductase [Chloroflexota bacterium]
GIAGVGAAIAAARGGCKTLLIEWASGLGGLATMGLVNIPLDFVSGIGQEMFDALVKVDGLWHRNSDPEKHKLVLDRMVQAAGCDLLLTTHVVESIMDGDRICGVVVESKSGREAILAQRVIDCSGDADAAAFAGAEFAVGRKEDGYTQGTSLEFRLGGVDWDRYSDWKGNDPKWIALIKQALIDGDLPYEIDNHLNWITHVPGRPEHVGQDEVSICFAHSRRCRPLDKRDLTRMYLEGREQCDILAKFIKKRVPGFENSWLVDTGSLLGVRDSRRIVGEYVLTARDLASLQKFDDVVTISHHGYDIHGPVEAGNIKWVEMEVEGQTRYVICNASGFSSSFDPPGGKDVLTNYWGGTEFDPQGFYDIPYRSLVPVKVDNLLVAGRCLSATFEAQSGTRLIMACHTMGQAAGTATALSLKHGIPPRKVDVRELQRKLMADGVNLAQATREVAGVREKA